MCESRLSDGVPLDRRWQLLSISAFRIGLMKQLAFYAVEDLLLVKRSQFRQIVKYRIKHRHSQKGEQQAHRLTSDDQHADRTVRAGTGPGPGQ